MIEHHKQSARSPEQPAPVEPENFQVAAGRRRFLKGLGIGLPAVMTLRSGALLAATSSRCLLNPPTATGTPDAFAQPVNPPVWLRDTSKSYNSYSNDTDTRIRESTNNGTPCYNASSGAQNPIDSTACDLYTQNQQPGYQALCYIHVDNDGQPIFPNPVSCTPPFPPTGGGGIWTPAAYSCAHLSFGL